MRAPGVRARPAYWTTVTDELMGKVYGDLGGVAMGFVQCEKPGEERGGSDALVQALGASPLSSSSAMLSPLPFARV